MVKSGTIRLASTVVVYKLFGKLKKSWNKCVETKLFGKTECLQFVN